MRRPPPASRLFPYTTLFRSQELGAKVSYRLEDAIGDVDVIMMLRLQQERMTAGLIPSTREYARFWGLTLDKLARHARPDRKSTRLNSSHRCISYAVFCLKKK